MVLAQGVLGWLTLGKVGESTAARVSLQEGCARYPIRVFAASLRRSQAEGWRTRQLDTLAGLLVRME